MYFPQLTKFDQKNLIKSYKNTKEEKERVIYIEAYSDC